MEKLNVQHNISPLILRGSRKLYENTHTVHHYNHHGTTHLLPLIPTGETISTIDYTTEIHSDHRGRRFYLKKAKGAGRQLNQLKTLNTIGVAVPEVIFGSASNGEQWYATSEAGVTISNLLKTEETHQLQSLLYSVGEALKDSHELLQLAPISLETIVNTYLHTPHIIDRFFYKWVTGNNTSHPGIKNYEEDKAKLRHNHTSKISNPVLTKQLREDLRKSFIPAEYRNLRTTIPLVEKINVIANHYLELLEPYIYYSDSQKKGYLLSPFIDIVDHHLYYGDFKPENIVAQRIGKNWKVTLIDPQLTQGNMYFDHATFISRFLLEHSGKNMRKHVLSFIKGNKKFPMPEMKVYGPFTIIDLIILDMINQLKKYLERYKKGNREYPILKALETEEYCNSIHEILNSLQNIKNQQGFDSFFS